MPQLLSVREARPFVLHFFLIIISVIVTICLAGPNRVYNLHQCRTHFTDPNCTSKDANIHHTGLLQSDITTMISLLASATRAAAAGWAGELLWRCAFMFMEKSEITLAGFSKVISGGITTLLPLSHVSSRKNWLLVYAIIFICFVMNYCSAILTGSVTWQHNVTWIHKGVVLTNLTEGIPGTNISDYRSGESCVTQIIDFAVSLSLVSWGLFNTSHPSHISPSNHARRAIFRSPDSRTIQHLSTDSKLDKIRLPYFKKEDFKYIADPQSTLTSQQWSLLNASSHYNPFTQGGYIALLPDTSWGPGSSPSLPAPVKITESRILGILVSSPTVPSCPPLPNAPQNINPYLTSNAEGFACFIFASMAYTAGAAICENCKIVSPNVAQGDISKMQPLPDPLTIEALAIASIVAKSITINNFALCDMYTNYFPSYQDFVIETLSQAYQSAWSSLVHRLGHIGRDNQTSVMVAVPVVQPIVFRWRVYLWATLHIAVLLGGIAFAYFQSRFRHPWVSDPVTAAFLLDTTGIFKQGEAADSDAKDPWHPDAGYPAGKLKLNDYDPSRPGKPRTVVLIPTRSIPHSGQTQLGGESDNAPLAQIV